MKRETEKCLKERNHRAQGGEQKGENGVKNAQIPKGRGGELSQKIPGGA